MAPVVPDRPRTPGAPRPAGPLPRRRTAGPGHLPGITGVPGLLAPGRPAGPALVALRAGRAAAGTGHRHHDRPRRRARRSQAAGHHRAPAGRPPRRTEPVVVLGEPADR